MKRLSWILIVCLSVSLISCGNNETENDPATTQTPETTETQETNQVQESTPEPLTDRDLVSSIEGQTPRSYIMEIASKFQDGLSMTVKTTVMDDYSKIETNNSLMPKAMVILYNPKEKIMYQYADGDTFGMKFTDVEDGMAGFMDEEAMDYSSLDLQDFEKEFGTNYTARKDTYNGQDVIYIESAFSTQEGMGQMKMWYSNEFFMPIKYELYVGDTLFMTSEVIQFDPTPSLEPKDFDPPEGMDFQELDMNMMMPNS